MRYIRYMKLSVFSRSVAALVFALFSFAIAPLYAAAPDLPVRAISVSGLKRTKPQVVDRLLRRYIGVSASSIDTQEVVGVLLETGIFENVTVSTLPASDGTSTELAVSVDEKWSLLPLPVFVATSSGITAGAAFIDANAFGLNDKIFSVALLLPTGWMVSAAFVDVPGNTEEWRWSLSTYVSMQDRKDVDAREEELRRYGLDAADLSFELAAPIVRAANVSVGLAFRERAVRDADGTTLGRPESSRAIVPRLGASFRASDWNGVFLSETSASIGAEWYGGLINDSFYLMDARLQFERPILDWIRLLARASAVYAPESPPVFEFGPQSIGLAVLPSAFSARSAVAGSLGLETRVAALPFGVISALASYQAALSEGSVIGESVDHGPVGGVRLYLAKVAVPAMDIGVAYNVATGIFRASFGIGMRM